MKNKIVTVWIVSALILVWLIWTTSANFGNFTSEDRESHKNVMNKLMDGETLTNDEQILVEEMKTRRAENSVYREERQAKREELAPIIEKRRAWEELTEDEQATLDAFRTERQVNWNKMWGKRWGGGKWGNRSGGNGWFNGECPYGE